MNLPISNCANRTNTDQHEPEQENAKEDANNCSARAGENPQRCGDVLRRSFEEDSTEIANDRIDQKSQHAAGQDRHDKIGHAQKWSEDRDEQSSPINGRGVCDDNRADADKLSHQTDSPAADELKQDESDPKRHEHSLPKH